MLSVRLIVPDQPGFLPECESFFLDRCMAVPQAALGRFLGRALLDDAAAKTLTRLSFQDDGRAVVYRFAQAQGSAGFWSRNVDDRLRSSIPPASVTVALSRTARAP